MPGHDCVETRVHINPELTDYGSQRVRGPRGVLAEAHLVVVAAWWDCWWMEQVSRRVGGVEEVLRREERVGERGLLNSERCLARLR